MIKYMFLYQKVLENDTTFIIIVITSKACINCNISLNKHWCSSSNDNDVIEIYIVEQNYVLVFSSFLFILFQINFNF